MSKPFIQATQGEDHEREVTPWGRGAIIPIFIVQWCGDDDKDNRAAPFAGNCSTIEQIVRYLRRGLAYVSLRPRFRAARQTISWQGLRVMALSASFIGLALASHSLTLIQSLFLL